MQLKTVEQSRTSTMSKTEFMSRFTDAELEAIYSRAKTSIKVEIWLDRFKSATEFGVNDSKLMADLIMLETEGVLVSGRSTEIMS